MDNDNILYCRNRFYIDSIEQEQMKSCKLVFGGAGLGSVIAECALRLGFQNICIIDGDRVELSNLNRQNYTSDDVGKYKTELIYKRLKAINPQANISYETVFLDEENIEKYLTGFDIAINAIDFTSNAPFLFDRFCISNNIPVLHPYNLGWAGFVTVVNDPKCTLETLQGEYSGFELKMAKYITGYMKFWNTPKEWLENVILRVEQETEHVSPPQLAVASWITAGLCANVMFNIVNKKTIKTFPDFYISSMI